LTGPLNGNLVCLPKKCVMLQLGHSNKHFKYNINNLVLPNVTEVKDLGIIVDHELKFKRHIQDITTRAHQRASLILRCLKSKEPILLFKAFVTYVRLLLEYSCQVWSPCYISLIRQVESVQKNLRKN